MSNKNGENAQYMPLQHLEQELSQIDTEIMLMKSEVDMNMGKILYFLMLLFNIY